ncbi:DUF4837 family protein [Brumimicrobium oceani]|uniref:DUF4837 domain-containing protein n=1 Tax=Brumimicrobium oceani TaxID=2100725 RepID=A0A2U2XBM0_9FLAO|nr:DUF4837 family protein [Brumimicrobium oceani]PWH85182.1 hypothetical protein DIT68_11135 [Brumimicrobium oceani]
MKNWWFILFLGFILTSCLDGDNSEKKSETQSKAEIAQDSTQKGGRKIINAGSVSQYTGKPGRLIVVAEPTEYIPEIETLFDSIFAAPMRPFYPPTPYFEVYQRSPKDFRRLSTRLRNVIELNIDEKIEKGNPTMHIYENYYAKTQLYTKLQAHDISDLYDLLLKEVDYLFTVYDRQEWKREYYRHPSKKNAATRNELKSKFGIDLTLPSKFSYESINDEYAIIMFPDRTRQMDMETTGAYSTSRANFIQSGVMIWQYPYTDERQLYPDNLMMMRDTILKYYAKHEMEGVYMGTQDHPAVIPQYEKLKVGDITGYQFRGLFKFTGAAEPSGGRFWSYHFKHPYRETIVALSGYLDAPPTMSASFDFNRIRAVIYSVKAVD